MKRSIIILISLLALTGLLLTSCFNPLGGDEMTGGSIRISVAPPDSSSARGLSGSARAIDTAVDTLVVKLKHSEYPALYGEEVWDDTTGADVTFGNVKQGLWEVQVYLNDSGNKTLYYGEGSVECFPGTTNTAGITIYPTGTINIEIDEGPLLAPAVINVNSINYDAQTVNVRINSPESTVLNWKLNDAATWESVVGTSNLPVILDIAFTDILYAKAIDPDGIDEAEISIFSFTIPYTTPNPATAYTSFIDVTLRTNQEGYSIRYTTDGSTPTYDHGTIAGNHSVITLSEAETVIQLVTYKAGFPETVTEAAIYTYNVVFATLQVDEDGTIIPNGSTNPLDFGIFAPSTYNDITLFLNNIGVGLDLSISNIVASGDKFYVNKTTATIPGGDEEALIVSFSPGADTGDFTGTLTITSNSTDGEYNLDLKGTSNSPPTVNLLSGVEVYGAGTDAVNGYYEQVADVASQDCFQHESGTYYIYYAQSGLYRYLIGTTNVYDSSDSDTRLYEKTYGTSTNYIGESWDYEGDNSTDNFWTHIYGAEFAPYVSNIYTGVGGWPNRLNSSSWNPLTAYYEYQDNESDSVSTIDFQWYSAANSTDPGSPISTATGESFTPTSTYTDKWLYVTVTPHAQTGEPQGVTSTSGRIKITNN